MEKVYYTIKEVATMMGVSESALRYWENEFAQLKPERTPGGRRRYTKKDIEVVKQIVYLLADQKLHVDGATLYSLTSNLVSFTKFIFKINTFLL